MVPVLICVCKTAGKVAGYSIIIPLSKTMSHNLWNYHHTFQGMYLIPSYSKGFALPTNNAAIETELGRTSDFFTNFGETIY